MIQQYFGSRKSIFFVLSGIILLAFLLLAWRIVSLQQAASKAAVEPVLKISYCGAEPEELCVLSFGRDVEDKLVVNLFVPDRKFPDFYLKIKRITGESVYECEKNKEIQTSVLCYGEMVNLLEKMEISLFAKADEHLMAMGNITLNAILISESSHSSISSTPQVIGSETPTSTQTPTKTPTSTPTVSYPNSSYPNSSYP